FSRYKNGDKLTARSWYEALMVSIFLIFAGQGTIVMFAEHLTSGTLAVLWSSVPIWGVVIDVIMKRQLPSIRNTIGLALSFIGISFLFSSNYNLDAFVAICMILFASLMWALGSFLSKMYQTTRASITFTAQQMIIGGTLLAFVSFGFDNLHAFRWAEILPESILGWLYLMICGSLLGYTLFTKVISSFSPTIANTYTYISPLITVFVGNLLLNEPITLSFLLNCAVILIGVYFIVTEEKKKETIGT
ncbi:MAG: DMT family transporter, partial [Bacilli bacterium]